MKTIYNVKALCVVALLGTTATMSAQEDTSKKQNLECESWSTESSRKKETLK